MKSTIKKTLTVMYVIFLLLLSFIIVLIVLTYQGEKKINQLNEMRLKSYQLADELRQSSDDLTRMARTYTLTGDEKYAQFFQEILDIRNGKKARPENYHRIYWDFAVNDETPPISKQKISLESLMTTEGVTKEEFAALQKAKDLSDKLVRIEMVAMNAVKGIFEDKKGEFTIKKAPDLDFAQTLMYNQEYHNEKAKIMRPINDFFILLEARTQKTIYEHETQNLLLLNTVIATIILSGIIGFIFIWLLQTKICNPIYKLVAMTDEVSKGNFSATYHHHTDDELGHLATAFTDMLSKIKKFITELNEKNDHITQLNHLLGAENTRMSTELAVTQEIQQMILPKKKELHSIEGLDIAGFMEPATEVGGDYYDVLSYNGRVSISIGDVTGHGLESGVIMLMVQTALRTLLENNITDLSVIFNVINRTIYRNVKRMETDKNLTLSVLDYQDGLLQVSGQHEDVLLVRKGGEIERIDTFDLGFIVGLEKDITPFVTQTQLELNEGDGIVLYTDGVTEAENIQRELYGIDRLCDVISTHWHLSASEIEDYIVQDIKNFIGEQKIFDDITLLIIKQQKMTKKQSCTIQE